MIVHFIFLENYNTMQDIIFQCGWEMVLIHRIIIGFEPTQENIYFVSILQIFQISVFMTERYIVSLINFLQPHESYQPPNVHIKLYHWGERIIMDAILDRNLKFIC